MEEDKKPGRTLQDYAHLFLSRSVDKEKQSTVSSAAAKPKEETEKQQQKVLSDEKSGQELPGVTAQAVADSPPQEKTGTDVPIQTVIENSHKRPYAVAVACPGKAITNSFLTYNLCLDFAHRGLQVMVLNADLSFPSINFLASLNLHSIRAAAEQHERQSGKPLSEIQLITIDTDITVLTCPWPDEQNPIIDEITSCAHSADVILINCATGFSSNAKAFFKAADEIILISGFEPAHLIDTYSIIKMIHQLARESRIGIIITGKKEEAELGFKKLHDAAQEFLKLHDAAQEFLGTSLCWYGFIPWDDEVMNSIFKKAPLPHDSAGAHAVHTIGEMLLNTRAQWQQTLNKQEPGFIEKLFITNGQATSWEKRYQSLTKTI